jgi:hypothetical protein
MCVLIAAVQMEKNSEEERRSGARGTSARREENTERKA